MVVDYYDGLPPVSDFIARYGLRAKKSLGQHFILDLNLTDRIARSVPDIGGSVVLEVGAGPGALTRALLHRGAEKVVAVELDRRALDALEEIRAKYGPRLEIVCADALSLDVAELKAGYAPRSPFRICANLPYNISVPLLARWLYAAASVDSMTLMFQKEVARRIAAPPGSRDYGRISILARLVAKVRVLFDVGKGGFHPAPKVDSSVVGFEKLAIQPGFDELSKVGELAKMAFSQRRKMLRSALRPMFVDNAEMEGKLAVAGISPKDRAEDVAPEGYLALAGVISR